MIVKDLPRQRLRSLPRPQRPSLGSQRQTLSP